MIAWIPAAARPYPGIVSWPFNQPAVASAAAIGLLEIESLAPDPGRLRQGVTQCTRERESVLAQLHEVTLLTEVPTEEASTCVTPREHPIV